MLTDAHCHPFDFVAKVAEEPRSVAIATSAWNREQFDYNASLSPPLVQGFAVHPQLPAYEAGAVASSLEVLRTLADENAMDAIGETGFDLFDERFRATESLQEELFAAHLEIAIAQELPLVVHIRRAMHKVFAYSKSLKKVPALVFHSYAGTVEEGESLLKRGINAYFSFGTPLLLNHKTARRCCARFPPERLLLETDAPYQPLQGAAFSSWSDIPAILKGVLGLREETWSLEELENRLFDNFCEVYRVKKS
jgi:TatD DNase family protein